MKLACHSLAAFIVTMKSEVVLLIWFSLLTAFSTNAQWEAKPQINVSGSAEVKVVPDEIELKVGVESRNEVLGLATRENDERVARSLSFLEHLQVSSKEIQTDHITIEPVYDEKAHFSPVTGLPLPGYDVVRAMIEPAYYLVRKNIGIRITNVAGFDLVLSGLVTNGVNHIEGISFRTSELRKHKDKARALAIQAAKEKAEAMTGALGIKLGKPLNISVNDSGGWYGWAPGGGFGGGGLGGMAQNAVQNVGGSSADSGPSFAVGQISVSANVNVSFLIE
jgi:uncharacterized protein YggE